MTSLIDVNHPTDEIIEGDGNPDLHGYPNEDREKWAKEMDKLDLLYKIENETEAPF